MNSTYFVEPFIFPFCPKLPNSQSENSLDCYHSKTWKEVTAVLSQTCGLIMPLWWSVVAEPHIQGQWWFLDVQKQNVGKHCSAREMMSVSECHHSLIGLVWWWWWWWYTCPKIQSLWIPALSTEFWILLPWESNSGFPALPFTPCFITENSCLSKLLQCVTRNYHTCICNSQEGCALFDRCPVPGYVVLQCTLN